MDSVQKVLPLRIRICRVDRFYRQGFVTQLLSVNFADDLRTNLISRGSQFHAIDSASREGLESRLRIRNDFAVDNKSDSVEQ